MFGKITIGKADTEMVANAATPYWFNQIFKEDFFVKSQEIQDGNDGLAVDLFSKAGFIMAKQAEKADMRKLNEDSFIEWLSEFEPMDMALAAADIAQLYTGQTKGTAKAKN
jgi:hypothetical protein